jgi:hypothetical protein
MLSKMPLKIVRGAGLSRGKAGVLASRCKYGKTKNVLNDGGQKA